MIALRRHVVKLTKRIIANEQWAEIMFLSSLNFQVHTFTAEGMYEVMVNVSNYLGSVEKTLHVVSFYNNGTSVCDSTIAVL